MRIPFLGMADVPGNTQLAVAQQLRASLDQRKKAFLKQRLMTTSPLAPAPAPGGLVLGSPTAAAVAAAAAGNGSSAAADAGPDLQHPVFDISTCFSDPMAQQVDDDRGTVEEPLQIATASGCVLFQLQLSLSAAAARCLLTPQGVVLLAEHILFCHNIHPGSFCAQASQNQQQHQQQQQQQQQQGLAFTISLGPWIVGVKGGKVAVMLNGAAAAAPTRNAELQQQMPPISSSSLEAAVTGTVVVARPGKPFKVPIGGMIARGEHQRVFAGMHGVALMHVEPWACTSKPQGAGQSTTGSSCVGTNSNSSSSSTRSITTRFDNGNAGAGTVLSKSTGQLYGGAAEGLTHYSSSSSSSGGRNSPKGNLPTTTATAASLAAGGAEEDGEVLWLSPLPKGLWELSVEEGWVLCSTGVFVLVLEEGQLQCEDEEQAIAQW